ncbi:MAG: hypothetical protein HY910_05800 [Desulfarculus sp.]|nr:hypothetical protein [Desulfarculus sp.]
MAKVSKSQQRLAQLEKEIKRRGVRLGYERLEYAGLRLKSGLCWFRGTYYLFVDRLKALPERLELLQNALDELDDLASQGRLDSPLMAEAQEVLESGQEEAPAPLGQPQEEPEPAPESTQPPTGTSGHEPA